MTAPPQQRIVRIPQGSPLPSNCRFVQWLGTETGLQYGPNMTADVILVNEVSAFSRQEESEGSAEC